MKGESENFHFLPSRTDWSMKRESVHTHSFLWD
jgi:hypothetical protein